MTETSNALAAQQGTAIDTDNAQQMDLLTHTICKGASPAQRDLFIQICNRTGLDPFAKQIYWTPKAVITAIDGYRLIAQRSGEYRGQAGPHWCGKDGKWRDVWLEEEPPAAARVGVFRDGFHDVLWGVATWRSYGKRQGNWSSMPDLMLAKCAESLALRKAFPQELSGLYTREEMAQASADTRPAMEPNAVRKGHVPPCERPAQPDPLAEAKQRLAEFAQREGGAAPHMWLLGHLNDERANDLYEASECAGKTAATSLRRVVDMMTPSDLDAIRAEVGRRKAEQKEAEAQQEEIEAEHEVNDA